jgi:hypothetical protein
MMVIGALGFCMMMMLLLPLMMMILNPSSKL